MRALHGRGRRHVVGMAVAGGSLVMGWRCPWRVCPGGTVERAMHTGVEGHPASRTRRSAGFVRAQRWDGLMTKWH
jgi:hypothetical protein